MTTHMMQWIGGFYLILMIWRATALKAQLKLPLFHGPNYFFDTHVGPAFYEGEGRLMMAEFRRRILRPMVVELAITAVIAVVFPGNFLYLLLWMVVAASAGAWIYNRVVWDMAKRGRAMETQVPAPQVMTASFHPRTAAQYRSAAYEYAIGGLTFGGLTLQAASVWQHLPVHFRTFLPSLTCLYLQLGISLAQRRLLESHLLRLPPGVPERFLEWREAYRLYWLRLLDIFRLIMAAMIFMLGSLPVAGMRREQRGPWLLAGLGIVTTVAMILTRKEINRLVDASKKVGAMPKVAPAPPAEARTFGRWFCWEKDLPSLIVRTPNRYALNLAHYTVYVFGAYLLGFVAMFGYARIGGR